MIEPDFSFFQIIIANIQQSVRLTNMSFFCPNNMYDFDANFLGCHDSFHPP
ncbi:hypothetical protein J2Z66_007720 [Paenibacillus eucommiae]|uniref:Uncharacterized protein n=1 Tax=Paenibacillus eucommiae TaxID=1355755 RepID=A0ABS4JA00_9BACL|nr:hypothetical protein [Paenibacillus eucommiae]